MTALSRALEQQRRLIAESRAARAIAAASLLNSAGAPVPAAFDATDE